MEWSEDSAVLTLRDTSHPLRTFYKLNQLRMDHRLCDVEIKVRNVTFAAHKAILASNSPRILNLLEGNHASIVFDDPLLNVQAVNTVFDFIYTSVLRIAKSNVQPLCYAAKYLQVERIEKACCKFMLKNVSVDCVSYFRFARTHGYEGLEQKCSEFISGHLDVIFVAEMTVDEMAAVLRRESLALDADGLVRVTSQWVAHDYSARVRDVCRLFDSVSTPWLVDVSKELSRAVADTSRQFPAGALDPERFFRALRHHTTTSKHQERSKHVRSSTTQQNLKVQPEPQGLLYAQRRSSANAIDSPIVVSGFVYSSAETAVNRSQLSTSARATKQATYASPNAPTNNVVDLPNASAGDYIPPQETLVETGRVNLGDPPQRLEGSASGHVSHPGLLVGNVTDGNVSPPKVLPGLPKTSVIQATDTNISPPEVRDDTSALQLSTLWVSTTPQLSMENQVPALAQSTGSIPWSLNSLGHNALLGAVGKMTSDHFTTVEDSSGHFTPVEGSSGPVERSSGPVEGSSGHFTPVEGSSGHFTPVEGSSGHFTPVEGSSGHFTPVEGSSGHFTPVEGSSGHFTPVEGSSGHFTPMEGSSGHFTPVEGSSGHFTPVEGSSGHFIPVEVVESSSGHFTPAEISLKSSPIQSYHNSDPGVSDSLDHIPTPKTDNTPPSKIPVQSFPDHVTIPAETPLQNLSNHAPEQGRKQTMEHPSISKPLTARSPVEIASISKPLTARSSVEIATKSEETTTKCSSNHVSSPEATMGIVYVAGGSTAVSVTASVEKYNPITGTWTQAPNLPKKRSHCALAFAGKKLYVLGGLGEFCIVTTVDIYDPQVGMWHEGSHMLRPKSNFGVAVLDGSIYCVGGSDGTGDLASVEVYDVQSNRWRQGNSLAHPRSYIQAAVLDGAIYAVGGSRKTTRLSTVEKLGTSGTWETAAEMNTPRSRPAVGSHCGRLYAMGGYDGATILRSAECYAPDRNRWTMIANMSVPRNSPGFAVVGSRILVCGGYNGKVIVNSCEFYDPVEDKWLPAPAMRTARCNFGTTIVSPVVTNTWL